MLVYSFFFEVILFILYLDLRNCIFFVISQYFLLYLACSLFDVVTLEHLFPAVDSIYHFIVFIYLALFIVIPLRVFIFTCETERVLDYVLVFCAIISRGRDTSNMWFIECEELIHNDGFFPILLERILSSIIFTLITFSFWFLICTKSWKFIIVGMSGLFFKVFLIMCFIFFF
jgi:hypothetical protein